MGSILVSIFVSNFVANTIIKPFDNFVSEVDKSIESKFKHSVSDSEYNLLSELSKAFNKAVEKAKKNNEEIENEVNERTKQLEKLTEMMTGRELKMRELKKEISQLKSKKNV